MRIVSFLPSATEILFALGLDDEVVGVTFECDYPPAARAKPQVVHSHLPPGLSPREVDEIVRSEGAQGRNLYFVDAPLLEALAPDLVILQDLCRVCAIDSPTLAKDVHAIPSRPEVLSLSAGTLDGVLAEIQLVGETTGAQSRAEQLAATLRGRIDRVRNLRPLPAKPRVLALEWLDPFFQGGHWIPEMIGIAGGSAVLAQPGKKSIRLSWDEVRAADPDLLALMPCGYNLPQTVAQYNEVTFPQGWNELRAVRHGQVFAVDGSAYFSRPGPRLVDGLEILSAILRGEPSAYVALGPAPHTAAGQGTSCAANVSV
jgi:iron complex transport system substrate-binding protein